MILNAKEIIKSWQERSEENKKNKKERDKHFPVMRFRLVIISVSL
jgi:hypothetical protein